MSQKHSPYPLPVVSYNFIARELRIRCPWKYKSLPVEIYFVAHEKLFPCPSSSEATGRGEFWGVMVVRG